MALQQAGKRGSGEAGERGSGGAGKQDLTSLLPCFPTSLLPCSTSVVQDKIVYRVADRHQHMLFAVEHVRLRRVRDVPDARVPDRLAGLRVEGHEIAAAVAREDQPA